MTGFPATIAGSAVEWWWRAVRDGPTALTATDLELHFSDKMRQRVTYLGDIDEFQAYAKESLLITAELVKVVPSGAFAVTVVFDAHETRFEMAVEVEAEPPHRIATYRLGLEGGASLTAVSMAIVRAVHHRVHSDWRVLDDPYAEALAGRLAQRAIQQLVEAPIAGAIAINTPARHRYAEDRLVEALDNGVDQYIVLGAGLDTSALRHQGLLAQARVFEVDHPRSQGWRLERLASAGMALPPNVRCVAVDLSEDTLTPALAAHGFDPSRPSFVSWLGVTYYLTLSAARETLRTIASWSSGTHLVFDYFLPPDRWPPDLQQQAIDFAALGEPWITWWTDEEVDRLLADSGLATVELLTTGDIIDRYAPNAPVELERNACQHIAHAVVPQPRE